MKKTLSLVILMSTFLLNGCIMERIEHQEALKADEADYRKCLLDHTDDASKCDALKQLYENDKAAGW